MKKLFVFIGAVLLLNVSVAAPAVRNSVMMEHVITNADCESVRAVVKMILTFKERGDSLNQTRAALLGPEMITDLSTRVMIPTLFVMADGIYKSKSKADALQLIGDTYAICQGSVGDVWLYYDYPKIKS